MVVDIKEIVIEFQEISLMFVHMVGPPNMNNRISHRVMIRLGVWGRSPQVVREKFFSVMGHFKLLGEGPKGPGSITLGASCPVSPFTHFIF